MRAAKVQASLRIRAVSPEPPLLAHTSSESRGTFRQKARSLGPLSGWACAVKIYLDRMLEDTNSLDGAHMAGQGPAVLAAGAGWVGRGLLCLQQGRGLLCLQQVWDGWAGACCACSRCGMGGQGPAVLAAGAGWVGRGLLCLQQVRDGWAGACCACSRCGMGGQGPAVLAAGAGWVGYVFCFVSFSCLSYLPFLMPHLLGDGRTF